MINILSNPFLQTKQLKSIGTRNTKTTSSVSLTTAILSLFTLTVVSYISFWILCNELISSNDLALSDIKNFTLVSGIISLVITFLSYYKSEFSSFLAPLYAVFSGVFISGLSFVAQEKFPGIAMLTVEITLATFIVVYLGYKLGIIKVSQKFKAIVYTMIGVISLIYLLSFVLMFFEIKIPLIHDTGIGGVIWSLFIMITASFHLAIDIDKIEKYSSSDGDKNWSLALGLMVSLIWLYISTLKVVSRISSLK
ncbi:MAG: Bax inhibitor-1/YccA family protein [Sulfurimonas sp.]|nr:Bax inhibitor-1/YccA family protein [Sulfurimonas sp.]MDQ7059913.1 Bax inhibitor-1/YccA family protein [Sulfurimonas sp.]